MAAQTRTQTPTVMRHGGGVVVAVGVVVVAAPVKTPPVNPMAIPRKKQIPRPRLVRLLVIPRPSLAKTDLRRALLRVAAVVAVAGVKTPVKPMTNQWMLWSRFANRAVGAAGATRSPALRARPGWRPRSSAVGKVGLLGVAVPQS